MKSAKIIVMALLCGATTLALGGCSATPDDMAPLRQPASEIRYIPGGQAGYIDQTINFRWKDDRTVVPTIEYSAWDSAGNRLDGVEVTTAFGSDKGLLAVGPTGGYDILSFWPNEMRPLVADVKAELTAIRFIDEAITTEDFAYAFSLNGEEVGYLQHFDAIAIHNFSPVGLRFQATCMIYDSPPEGWHQQVMNILDLGSIDIDAGDEGELQVGQEHEGSAGPSSLQSCGSIKVNVMDAL